MRRSFLPVLLLALASAACKTDECELGESPCDSATTFLECHPSSSHVPDFNPSFNRFVQSSCGELFSRCVPQGEDGHSCELGFAAEPCEVLSIGPLDDRGARELLVGELSGDGHADILIASPWGMSIARHTPDGTFAPAERLPEQTRPIVASFERRAFLVDLDADGRLDVLREVYGSLNAEGDYGHRVDVLFARGGGFEARDLGVDLRIDYVGDLDDDGTAEVVAVTGGDAFIVRFEDGAFERTAFTIEPMSGVEIRSVVAADLFGTGEPLLIARSWDALYVLAREGEDYVPIEDPTAGAIGPNAVFADLDHDGATDVVELSQSEPAVRVRLSNGDGSFREQRVPLPHRPPALGRHGVSDVDGDGSLDLVLDHEHGIVSVVLNDGTGVFLEPRTFQLDHAPLVITAAPLDSTNPQADLVTLHEDGFIGFVPAACL